MLSALKIVPNWSPAQWLQAFYIVATGLVLGVAVLPKRARGYLLTYGARGSKSEKGDRTRETGQDRSGDQYRDDDQDADDAQHTEGVQDGEDGQDAEDVRDGEDGQNREDGQDRENGQDDWFAKFVAFITSCGQIPHSWFGGFYAVSLTCSVFWLVQYLTDGRILHFLTTRQASASAPGMEPGQVVLLWSMMFLQGSRRLFESLVLVKPGSKSTMWIVHWLLGNVYYITMSLSVWIEGSGETPQLSFDVL
jgi:3-oxo-5-alpha-steroid 4-dehydrogenase 3